MTKNVAESIGATRGRASRAGSVRRLSRRRLMGWAAAGGAGLSGLALAGCGGGKAPSGAASQKPGGASGPSSRKRGGTLTVSLDFQRGFDPHVLEGSSTSMFGLFYSNLVRANPKTSKLEPDLAAKWEVPSQTELVFTLAPNVKWQDKPPASGRALKADDVVYSLKRIQTNAPRFVNKQYLADVDRIEAPDDHTVKLTLKQPNVAALSNLAVFSVEILAPEVVEAAKGNLATADSVVGTGAFVLTHSEHNVGSSLVRNPSYFKPGLPYLDKVELRAFRDAETEWAALLAGDLDHDFVPGQDSQKFLTDNKGRFQTDWFPDQVLYIIMAMTQKKPFNDPRVTRALRLFIDHSEIEKAWTDVWFGRGRYSTAFAAATAENWDLTDEQYRQHLEWKDSKDDAVKEALGLLNAAGFSKEKPLQFAISGQTAGQGFTTAAPTLIQAQFKRLSQGVVNPELKLLDGTVWGQVRANGAFDYFVAGHISGGVDPDTYFSSTYQTGGGLNYGKMSDPKLDQMFAKQRALFNEPDRKKAVLEIMAYMIDNSPYTVFADRYVLNATKPNLVGLPAESTTIRFGSYYEGVSLA